MTRTAVLLAVLSFICAGAAVFRRMTTGLTEDPFVVFALVALMLAFVMLALLYQRVSRLEAAPNQKNHTTKDH